MHRTILGIAMVLLGASASAQDVLTIGSGIAQSGGTAAIPVSVADHSGTSLGVDAGTGNRIQGFAFKVLFPTEIVTSVSFVRAGVAASVTPLHETALQGSGWSSCIVSFHEASNPIAFNLNAAAPGDRIGTLTVTLRGDAVAGSTASLLLDPPSAMLSNQAGSVLETVAAGNLSLVNGSITVSALAAPSGVVATAINTAQVNINWNAVSGADHYEVWRSSLGDEYAIIGSPSGTALSDATVDANTTYLYVVRAIDPSDEPSAFSSVDAATTIAFTDDPLTAMTTTVKLVHITQLRTAVDAMRAAANLDPLDGDATVGAGLIVRAQHLLDLRTGLDEARSAIGLTALSYTDPAITAGATTIKAAHVTELRNGVK
ncbi:MAG: hypothetical protein M3P06_25240 [Acidobacteriota bacterium]|nr:hypothetical protein [Acidobacteriota bacterium]